MHRRTGDVKMNIVEYCFIDNEADFKHFEANWQNYAEAALKGLCNYAGFDYKPPGKTAQKSAPAPAPVAPKPAPAPASKKEYAYFPPGKGNWSVYPLNKQPVKANAIGAINPSKFGGLTYEVLGHPYANVVTIKTTSFGKVNVYVGDPNSKVYTK
jgi:hypothetical protein